MKTIKTYHIFKAYVIFFILINFLESCNKDDALVQTDVDEKNGISLKYPDSLVQTTFRKQGSIAPIEIDWNGEKGTLSISSTTTILESNNIKFEEDTGIIFWSRLLPLGEFDLTVSAKNNTDSVSTKIKLKHNFDKGYFSGGFKAGNPTEIDPTTISDVYGLTLHEDHTVDLNEYSDPTFSASGTWQPLENGTITIEYISNGETTYMKGELYIEELENKPILDGVYSNQKNESWDIPNPIGRFVFRWD
ncbi:hypothetical protein [Aurantibacter sp.]|uniref:hypothetical protein n=1 Tax=Aurantibacter sp. TaxID=2807103 RepID=UPI00326617A2